MDIKTTSGTNCLPNNGAQIPDYGASEDGMNDE
jgi:hypothetical protein